MEHELETLEQDFKNWRATRKKQGPIPEHLKQKVMEMQQYYSISELVKRLKIHRDFFRRLEKDKNIATESKQKFIEISSDTTNSQDVSMIQANISYQNMSISLEGRVCDIAQLISEIGARA